MVRKRRWRVVAALAACTLLSACALVFDVHDFDDAFDAAFDASDGADGPTPLDPNRYRAAVLADHPLAYWRLGESAAAVTAFDETDGGHNAVFAISDGGCGFGADGAIVADPNTAIVFGDGCAATSDASDFYFAGTAPMTIEAWIYSTADGSDSTRRNIFIRTVNLPTPADAGPGCNDGGARRHGYQFDVSNGSVNYRRIVDDCELGLSVGLKAGFNHAVGVYDGSHLFLWVDGVPTTLSKMPDTRPIQAGANATSSIGHSPPPTGMSGFLGTLDEVAIYSTALDAGSIQHHYQVGLGNE